MSHYELQTDFLSLLNKKNIVAAEQREQTVQSNLAKLLATENIHVEFRKAQTASFNVKSRVLTIPIYADKIAACVVSWNVTHEVAHALYTPRDGWYVEIKKRGLTFKDYLNVVEDLRINRLIVVKYPGTLRDRHLAYNELYANDFYGDKKDLAARLSTMLLVDRMNLFGKVGPQVGNYAFSPAEQVLVDRAATTTTWDEVVELANDVFNHDRDTLKNRKASAQEMLAELENILKQDSDMHDDEEDDADMDGLDEPESMPKPEASEDEEDDLSDMDDDDEEVNAGNSPEPETEDSEDPDFDGAEDGEAEAAETEEDEEGEEEPSDDEEAPKGSIETTDQEGEEQAPDADEAPQSETELVYTEKEKELVDPSSRDVEYVTVPMPPSMSTFVVPYKKVLSKFMKVLSVKYSYNGEGKEEHFNDLEMAEKIMAEIKRFRTKHDHYVNHLVREFEMKRNAWQFARTMEANSGSLNMNKLHQYKFNDDLFKKIQSVPKGKNHGMIMVIDLSGSMSEIISDVIEQAAVLAMFCRRVNIPFRVYGFTTGRERTAKMFDHEFSEQIMPDMSTTNHFEFDTWYYAIELMSERMSLREFNQALYALSSRNVRRLKHDALDMGGTPLDEVILSTPHFIKAMKNETGAEKVSVVFLTDGAGGHSERWVAGGKPEPKKSLVFAVSPFNKHIIPVEAVDNGGWRGAEYGYQSFTKAYLKMIEDATGATMIGYHIVAGRDAAKMLNEYAGYYSKSIDAMKMDFRNNQFMSIDKYGYKEYFVLWDKALKKDDEDLSQVKQNSTVKGLASALNKMQTSRAANRTFLTKFVEQVA